ncbi:hypothetical protein YQE_01820, partial [Dendroctonus ponderosae]
MEMDTDCFLHKEWKRCKRFYENMEMTVLSSSSSNTKLPEKAIRGRTSHAMEAYTWALLLDF